MKRKYLLFFPATLSVAALTGTFVAAAIVQHATPTIYSEKILLSALPKSENLIEIFSDGFDVTQQRPLLENNPVFKDFALFTNFYSQGAPTHGGRPSELGGFANFNAFSTLSRYPTKTLYQGVFEEGEMTKAMQAHFDTLGPYFDHRYLINPFDLLAPSGTDVTSPEWARRSLPDVEITTSMGALESLTSTWGVNETAPSWRAFPYFAKVAEVSPQLKKGSHVLISDITTHSPKTTSEHGALKLDASLEEVSKAVTNGIGLVINKLQTMMSQNQAAYDNSLIIVYGDHSEHTLDSEDGTYSPFVHAHSALLIKYPRMHQEKLRIMNEALVYGSQINGIIKNYFEKRPETPLAYFNNARFALSRPMYIIDGAETYFPARFDEAKQMLVRDNSRSNIVFNPATYAAQVEAIFKAVSEGSDE